MVFFQSVYWPNRPQITHFRGISRRLDSVDSLALRAVHFECKPGVNYLTSTELLLLQNCVCRSETLSPRLEMTKILAHGKPWKSEKSSRLSTGTEPISMAPLRPPDDNVLQRRDHGNGETPGNHLFVDTMAKTATGTCLEPPKLFRKQGTNIVVFKTTHHPCVMSYFPSAVVPDRVVTVSSEACIQYQQRPRQHVQYLPRVHPGSRKPG